MKITRVTTAIIAFLLIALNMESVSHAGEKNVSSGSSLVLDFTRGAKGWTANPRVTNLHSGPEGLSLSVAGEDPWIESPALEWPSGNHRLLVTIKMKSTADRSGQLFFGRDFNEGGSAHFVIQPDGQWHDYRFPIPAQESGARLRVDPAAQQRGEVTIRSIEITPLRVPAMPKFDKPVLAAGDAAGTAGWSVASGGLLVAHGGERFGSYRVSVDGALMAAGYADDRICWMDGGRASWQQLNAGNARVERNGTNGFTEMVSGQIPSGGAWRMSREFEPGQVPGTISVRTTFVVDRAAQLMHVPMLTVFPGIGSFGREKKQAVFAGLEYLDNEPSSSELDIHGPAAERRIPDPLKITFPLMAIAAEGRYIGVTWQMSHDVASMFDSPDRVFGADAHLFAFMAPGVGELRLENDRLPHSPLVVQPDKPLEFRATLLGGTGESVVPAVEKVLDVRKLPSVPQYEGGCPAAMRFLADGWLESEIYRDGRWRHAFWGENWGFSVAGDAPAYLLWLANHIQDSGVIARLRREAQLGMERNGPDATFAATVSHVVRPFPPLVLGNVPGYVREMRSRALSALDRFDTAGIVHYRPQQGKPDYGKGHWADHANGLTAQAVVTVVNAALLTADATLTSEAVRLLDALSIYDKTVPRGAQTWELALHTPDILASAYLVDAFAQGYVLTGRRDFLERARYWAWTGIPFVYLEPRAELPVCSYATIAVFGATNWTAPHWIGMPVQWCGLVYGSALHRLADVDSDGPWRQIARGITGSGLQQCFPLSDRARGGLLPDFYHLREQSPDGPAINPGTVEARLPEYCDTGTLYDCKPVRTRGWFAHAPCRLRIAGERRGRIDLDLEGWGGDPYWVLFAGVREKPRHIEFTSDGGKVLDLSADAELTNDPHLLVVRIPGGPGSLSLVE